ncbi:hypothetical protein WG907_09345 [Sphingobium sp. AN558]|uniref:hypothetical protein n=1 Tax=Sphingobium sp. AN558 TaxID=3133442 RepID=UPI0030C33264
MQLWKTSAAVVFLGSYLPLSVILMGQDLDFPALGRGACPLRDLVHFDCASPLRHPFASVTAIVVCALCFLASLLALRILPTKHKISIVESKHIPADLINYVIPYVLSFISLDFGDPAKLLGFAIFLVWLFWITYKSGQIALNPILAVLGWKLFEVKYSHLGSTDVLTGRILSSTEIGPSETYRQGSLQDVMVVKA